MQGFKKLVLPLMIAAALVAGAGCGDKKDKAAEENKPTQVAAKVNGEELTVSQVNFALQRIPNLDKEQSKAASLQVIRNLVDQEVLAQKAQSEKLDRDPTVVQALDAARRQIMAEAYMSRALGTTAEPSDAEVNDYFNKHPELFIKRKIYRLQEVAIKAPKDKLEAIGAQLRASKSLDEFVDWLKAEKYPAQASQAVKAAERLPLPLVAKLSEMPDGQAMIVNTSEGVTVVMLADSQLQPVTLEQAKPAIASLLQNEARQKAAKAELDKVKAEAKIEYVGEFADAGKEPATAPAEPAATPDASAEPAGPAESVAAPATPAAPAADADAISKGVSGLK